MTLSSLTALLPLIILASGSVIVMMGIAFRRNHALTLGLTLATFLLAFIAIPFASSSGTGPVTPLLIFDTYAYFIIGLLISTSFVISLLAFGYQRIHVEKPDEFYLLLILATLGASVLASSSHFASFFLGLEILSVSLYAMIAYSFRHSRSIEAGAKYLILAASSAAFLLFGMALVYADLGTMEFFQISDGIVSQSADINPVLLLTGLVMMLVGIGYKLALVPFHMWTPDVYEGAPAPVTAFVSTVSKGSMFAILLRFFLPLNLDQGTSILIVFVVVAVATMLIGTLLALTQTNLKRLLAYSSIANLGYLLVAFIAGGANAITASTFYLVAYFVTILAAFGVLTILSSRGIDAGDLEVYRGLMWQRSWLAAILTAAMFSLAGIPLTVGFVGKFYLVLAGVGSALWLLVVVLVISSGISLYYYLRVIAMMFRPAPEQADASQATPSYSLAGGIAMAGLLLVIVWLGVYPAPLIQVIQNLATVTW